jgi:Uma2 family endonuclease
MQKLEMRRWTRREYDRMVEAGILGEDDPVELIDGEIVKMAPEGKPHASAVRRAHIALQRVFGPQGYVQVGLPMAPDDASEPEPDLAVLPGTVEDFEGEHPSTALLVVEVAESSLRFDRKRKGSLYARAGIPEYWIVNLKRGRLEVYRDPMSDPDADLGWRYRTVRSLTPAEEVVPLGTDQPIAVADLLPRSVLERTS